jgi:tyrosyl-DNA phosphodiesterase-1
MLCPRLLKSKQLDAMASRRASAPLSINFGQILGDNHWYIHDVPKVAKVRASRHPFESDLLGHLNDLGTPHDFVHSIAGMYDYSTVKVQLVTSVPGTYSGSKAEKYGLLRLRRVVNDLGLDLGGKEADGGVKLEVCTASIGNLSTKWLSGFHDCCLGKEMIKTSEGSCGIPDMKLFYPTVEDVKGAHPSSKDAASNIGCHTRPWNKAPDAIKNLFHHYQSKDKGRLFHQKFVMAYNPRASTDLPYYVYVGSANLSGSAWGYLEQDKKGNVATGDLKLVKLRNFECGVVIPGHLIESLLEPGTKNWMDGIIPYDQEARKYSLQEKPWNDPRWVKGYDEGSATLF